MTAIAREYMQRIGFGDQPYLVYRHDDTAHQHLLSTKIKPDGSRIPESFIGVRKSQPARRAIEEKFGLVRSAQAQKNTRRLPARTMKYGKQDSFQAMADTLHEVLQTYSYRSLPELNALLGLYNLTAKTGRPGSRLHDKHGLSYQVLDPSGHRTTPIKARAFDFNPGLQYLEKRFAAQPSPGHMTLQLVARILDAAVRQNPAHAGQFADLLRRDQLAAVPTHDKQGALTALFFIDLSARTVSTPADLGPNYDAATLRSRLPFDPFPSPEKVKTQEQSLQQTQQLQKQKGRHL